MGPIRGDEPVGADPVGAPGHPVVEGRRDAVPALLEGNELGGEPQLRAFPGGSVGFPPGRFGNTEPSR